MLSGGTLSRAERRNENMNLNKQLFPRGIELATSRVYTCAPPFYTYLTLPLVRKNTAKEPSIFFYKY